MTIFSIVIAFVLNDSGLLFISSNISITNAQNFESSRNNNTYVNLDLKSICGQKRIETRYVHIIRGVL